MPSEPAGRRCPIRRGRALLGLLTRLDDVALLEQDPCAISATTAFAAAGTRGPSRRLNSSVAASRTTAGASGPSSTASADRTSPSPRPPRSTTAHRRASLRVRAGSSSGGSGTGRSPCRDLTSLVSRDARGTEVYAISLRSCEPARPSGSGAASRSAQRRDRAKAEALVHPEPSGLACSVAVRTPSARASASAAPTTWAASPRRRKAASVATYCTLTSSSGAGSARRTPTRHPRAARACAPGHRRWRRSAGRAAPLTIGTVVELAHDRERRRLHRAPRPAVRQSARTSPMHGIAISAISRRPSGTRALHTQCGGPTSSRAGVGDRRVDPVVVRRPRHAGPDDAWRADLGRAADPGPAQARERLREAGDRALRQILHPTSVRSRR